MKVAIYARRSQADERRGSVPGQLRRCRALAVERGWEVVGEFKDDGVSGWDTTVTREGYQAMLAASWDAVIVDKADRLTRQDSERAAFERLGKNVYLSDGTMFDLGTAQGRRSFRDAGTAAAFYSDQLSERVKDAVRERVEAGYWTGGRRPFAFDLEPEDGYVTLVQRPREAAALRRAYEGLLNGMSLKALARELNAEGFRTTQGNVWAANSLRTTLYAPRNAAMRSAQSSGRDCKWDPIVDVRTWRAARAILEGNVGRTRGDAYQLTGLVFCEEHAARMFGRPVSGVRKYACNAGGPMHLGIDAARLETYVGDQSLLAGVEQVAVHDPSELPAELLAERDRLDGLLARWAREAAEAGLSAAEIRDGRAGLVEQRAAVEAQLEAAAATAVAEPLLVGRGSDEHTAYIRRRIERVDVRPVGRGGKHVPIEDRVTIVWREGVTLR